MLLEISGENGNKCAVRSRHRKSSPVRFVSRIFEVDVFARLDELIFEVRLNNVRRQRSGDLDRFARARLLR